MSWSIGVMGRPKAVKAEIARQVDNQTGDCKAEMAEAMKHVCGLIDMNYPYPDREQPIIKVEGSGSGSWEYSDNSNPKQIASNCTVKVEVVYVKWCEDEGYNPDRD
jgi:hypothetical protein